MLPPKRQNSAENSSQYRSVKLERVREESLFGQTEAVWRDIRPESLVPGLQATRVEPNKEAGWRSFATRPVCQ